MKISKCLLKCCLSLARLGELAHAGMVERALSDINNGEIHE